MVNKRGAEQILKVILEIYPQADIFTLANDPKKTFETFRQKKVTTSFIQHLPFSGRHFRMYLPLFPKAVESFDLRGYDLVISVHHCVAKGAKAGKGARHISYCLTPMRYIWVYEDEYFGRFRKMARPLVRYLKRWDVRTAANPDIFLAISNHVRGRVKRCYNKDSEVVFPPVDTGYFLNESPPKRENFYLIVGELVPYKRTELAIRAFNAIERPLVIIGNGPCRGRLKKMAGRNIKFLDWQPAESLKDYYSRARALVYPQKEDFGIVAVEAQAAGCPVIAYKKGGALDTVVDGVTGVFFEGKTPGFLIEAIRKLDTMRLSHRDIVENAKRFDKEIFKERFIEAVEGKPVPREVEYAVR